MQQFLAAIRGRWAVSGATSRAGATSSTGASPQSAAGRSAGGLLKAVQADREAIVTLGGKLAERNDTLRIWPR